MSWLESVSDGRDTAATEADHRTFLRHRVAIERDEEQELVVHRDATGSWIHAFASREALARSYGLPVDELDGAEMTGAQLRTWVRQHCPEAGVVFRRGVDEQVMVRPAAPVQRVVLE